MLEDGDAPVVAEGEAAAYRDAFPTEVTAAFTAKYDWDVAAPRSPGRGRVLLKVPVRRWLLAGVAQ
ncbi:hypothetical protein [Streptomyces sp. NPDC093984]|uniref:hypothetical protein n=1 Tax=Streptomyces sp. NPDC093984 TaxID=3366052 RepID=UPI0037F73E9C